MLNHIVIMGRLVRDPELRRTGSGIAVTSFTVAVDRDFASKDQQRETDFIDCVAWRYSAEFVAKYFTKGSMIVVAGRLQIRPWTDKDGNKRRTAEVVADNCYFGEGKRSNGGQAPGAYGSNGSGGNGYPAPGNGSYGGYGAPAPAPGGYGGNGYPMSGNGGYSGPAPSGGYGGGYSAPAYGVNGTPGSDFAMLEDDDAQLPF